MNTLFHFQLSGIQGDGIGDVKFNSDGDRIGRYSIFQYQKTPDEGYKYVWVGEFGEYPDLQFAIINETIVNQRIVKRQELALDTGKMRWHNITGKNTPESVCSYGCPMGYVKNFVVSIEKGKKRKGRNNSIIKDIWGFDVSEHVQS